MRIITRTIAHVEHGKTVLSTAIEMALAKQTKLEDSMPLEITVIDADGLKLPEINIDRFGAMDCLEIQKRGTEKEIDRAAPMPKPYNRYGNRNR